METLQKNEGTPPAPPPPSGSDNGLPAAPLERPAPLRDRPARPKLTARAWLVAGLTLVVGLVLGGLARPYLGAPPLRLAALDDLLTTARTALGLGAPHPAETTRPAESLPPAAPLQAAPTPTLEANVVTVDDAEAQRLKIAPVQLRAFREEKTAVGRIAFNDDHTTAIFAPFQGRVLHLIAKPGDVLHPGSPLLMVHSSNLVQAHSDLLAANVVVQKAQNQLTQT